MRKSAILLLFACQLVAQAAPGRSREQEIPAGAPRTRLSITLDRPPDIGDRFIVNVTTTKIRTSLIPPAGGSVNAKTAESAGLSWSSMPFTPALGSTDDGCAIAIEFTARGKSGRYVFEFDAREATSRSHVDVTFISGEREYESVVPKMPGFRRIGPVSLTAKRPVTLTVNLARKEEAGVFDIVVSDPAATVAVTLPGGRVLQNRDGKEPGVEWMSTQNVADVDPPESFFGLSGILLHRKGTHHVFMIDEAPSGSYVVRAESSKSGRADVTLAFIPVGRLLQQAMDGIDKLGAAPPGAVRLQPFELPKACHVGDRLEIMVGLLGDPVTDPINFEVRAEYREPLGRGADGGLHWGDAVVENPNVLLTRRPDGRYAGTLTPTKPGLLRVGIKANGKTLKGKPFTQEVVVGEVNVQRLVARYGSMTEKAVRRAGTDKYERLDITAHIDVVLPGRYEMRLVVGNGDATGIPLGGSTTATLSTGEQTLTVSFKAEQIRRRLKDGPWIVRDVQIFRPEGNTFGDSVATGKLDFKTADYRRDEWDRGDAFTDEQVTARGIYPASSGRFQMVEIEWGVTTPGGECSWLGILGMDGYESRNTIANGVLPPGRTTLSFVLDASIVAAAPASRWYFTPMLNCRVPIADDHASANPHVTLDPAQFESRPSFLDVQMMARVHPGGAAIVLIDVRGKKRGDIDLRVGVTLPGIAVSEPQYKSDAGWAAQYMARVSVAPTAEPGRYFVPLIATAGSETATTAIVVDIVP